MFDDETYPPHCCRAGAVAAPDPCPWHDKVMAPTTALEPRPRRDWGPISFAVVGGALIPLAFILGGFELLSTLLALMMVVTGVVLYVVGLSMRLTLDREYGIPEADLAFWSLPEGIGQVDS